MTEFSEKIIKMNRDNFSFSKIPYKISGQVKKVVGGLVEAALPKVDISNIVQIQTNSGLESVMAEVVGFRNDRVLLLPYGNLSGVSAGSPVFSFGSFDKIYLQEKLLGRVFDPFMNDLNEPLQSLVNEKGFYQSIEKMAPNPLKRQRIDRPLSLGVKAIDGLLTFCEGQRIGVMAGSGVGKSVLMGMIAKGSCADVNVIGLIGERGREVREFIENDLGPDGLKNSIVVVSTSDQSPLMRIRAAKVVLTIAEYFSFLGKKVLVMMDSLTRVAQAQREIGLAVGEPPTTKGYPPSVVSLLPKLLERCGPQISPNGSISALFTVLVDGDDFNDPVPDIARSILDGHICLSRDLAQKAHFPAIDVSKSVSRVMKDIVSENHLELANAIKTLMAVYEENIDFIQLGTYQQGTNPLLDQAINLMPKIQDFLQQKISNLYSMEESIQDMIRIFK